MTECSNILPSASLDVSRLQFATVSLTSKWNRAWYAVKTEFMNQVERLLQQIVVVDHASYAQAKSLRIACSDWLRKLKYGVKPQFS